jgi:hypothetical protein
MARDHGDPVTVCDVFWTSPLPVPSPLVAAAGRSLDALPGYHRPE